MAFNIRNKVAIVTGGSSGIGFETVELLLSQGAKVAWCGRNVERLQNSYAQVCTNYPDDRCLALPCEVLDKEQVEGFVANIVRQFGQIDMLINNAGQGLVSNFDNTTDEQWISEVKLKYFSVLHIIKATLPYLRKSEIGSITNINSLLALKPEPQMIATSAARAGLLNLTKTLSRELAPENIRINSVLIGMVESGQWEKRYEQRSDKNLTWEEWIGRIAKERNIPMGRLGYPCEVANALVFLASPLASYITGSTIEVTGGFSLEI